MDLELLKEALALVEQAREKCNEALTFDMQQVDGENMAIVGYLLGNVVEVLNDTIENNLDGEDEDDEEGEDDE